MTKEQLQKGQRLITELQDLSNAVGRWTNLTEIMEIGIKYQFTYNSIQNSAERKVLDYIDIERLKQEAISNMKAKIAELEKELKEL